MITIILILIAIFWVALMAMQSYSGELIISPVIGIMFGALYDKDFDLDKEYHTVQILLICVAFTFTWETNA